MANNITICDFDIDVDAVLGAVDLESEKDVLLAWVETDYFGNDKVFIVPRCFLSDDAKILIIDGEWTDDGRERLRKPITNYEFEFELECLPYRS